MQVSSPDPPPPSSFLDPRRGGGGEEAEGADLYRFPPRKSLHPSPHGWNGSGCSCSHDCCRPVPSKKAHRPFHLSLFAIQRHLGKARPKR